MRLLELLRVLEFTSNAFALFLRDFRKQSLIMTLTEPNQSQSDVTDSAISADPGSYRDPSARVVHRGLDVLRVLSEAGARDFRGYSSCDVIQRLQREGRLIAAVQIENEADVLTASGLQHAALTLAHPRLSPITYPFEWPFAVLKMAALAHLDLHLELLADGLTLRDASAYNIQFLGTQPVFIDITSIRPYVDGEMWDAHEQFVRQFLGPLALEAYTGVSFAPFLRSCLEGIPVSDLAPLLPARARFDVAMITNVFALAMLERRVLRQAGAPVRSDRPTVRQLPKTAFVAILRSMRKSIARLEPKVRRETDWSGYATDNSYAEAATAAKSEAITRIVAVTGARRVVDAGCNDGVFSMAALAGGATSVIGLDADGPSLDRYFRRAQTGGLNMLPLRVDLANASPSQGWGGVERSGLFERVRSDFVIALAILHHLVIGRNVPMNDAVAFVAGLGDVGGIVEFVPAGDPMAAAMLGRRPGLFPDYTPEHFFACLQRYADVVEVVPLPDSSRFLVHFRRKVAVA